MASRGGEFKRNRRGEPRHSGPKPNRDKTQPAVDESSPVVQAFRKYQEELDTRHDKHERLVKLSRDVTIESKRIIFLLHRTIGNENDEYLKEADEKFVELESTKWSTIARELHGEDPYRFLRAYSPGLQEYIEAVSFHYYIQHKDLIPLWQVEKRLRFSSTKEEADLKHRQDDTADGECTQSSKTDSSKPEAVTTTEVHIPPTEYMLGIADLTGEIMRMAISSIGKGDLALPSELCKFLRIILDAFVSYGNTSRELNRKLWTLKQSVQKVENACYTVQVRGSEMPKHMLVDALSSKPSNDYSEEDMGQADNT